MNSISTADFLAPNTDNFFGTKTFMIVMTNLYLNLKEKERDLNINDARNSGINKSIVQEVFASGKMESITE